MRWWKIALKIITEILIILIVKVNSNTQLYKQAGNSICCNVLEQIFGAMLGEQE